MKAVFQATRILSAVTMGWEYWTEDKKPKRSKTMFKVVPVDADLHAGWPARYFWAFVVRNFDTKQIEILEITQLDYSDRVAVAHLKRGLRRPARIFHHGQSHRREDGNHVRGLAFASKACSR
jgi:hypothetical protein